MDKMTICLVAGARPNFIKIAPIIEAISNHNSSAGDKIDYFLVHTGQHYDRQMSKLFFEDLEIPSPDIDLEVGSGTHAVQTAEIMKRFEKVCLKKRPTHVLVVGDVNSTIACALVASKLGVKVIHVESGLRSFDRSMPEEINRILTDAISDYLFITEKSAEQNLLREGIPKDKIYFVGNVMIDTLLKHKKKAERSPIFNHLGLINNSQSIDSAEVSEQITAVNQEESIDQNCLLKPYTVLTLHRPSNVDNFFTFKNILQGLTEVSKMTPIIFPIHPRTLNSIKKFGLEYYFESSSVHRSQLSANNNGIHCVEPLGYLDFLQLMSNARLVLTDSGGIQEETTILGIPCVTLRENTERPVTITHGTNVISGVQTDNIIAMAVTQLGKLDRLSKLSPPPLWDGRAAERIIDILTKLDQSS